MTSDRIEDLLRGDVPARDPAARERARVRLRAAMALAESPPRRRSRWLAYAAASSVAAVLLVLLQLMLPPLGPAGPRLSAAAEVRQLGVLSSRQTSLQIGASDYLYRREEQILHVGNEAIGVGTTSYTLQIHAIVESWITSDGSGQIRTLYRSVDFVSEEDRLAWEAAGSPPLPPIGEPIEEDSASGGRKLYAVEALPTQPAPLEQALDEGKIIATAAGDANRLSTIGTLLAQGNASPDLRRALFEVAAEIPGVVVTQQATDPLGRAAVWVSASDSDGETRLYFDPIDASLLASTRSHPADSGAAGPAWHMYLESGVVSAIGEQPSP